MKISATIITLNEQGNIARAIESLRCADEVLVIDCGSSDRTIESAAKLGARVVEIPWRGYAGQKNFAAEQAAVKLLELRSDAGKRGQRGKQRIEQTDRGGQTQIDGGRFGTPRRGHHEERHDHRHSSRPSPKPAPKPRVKGPIYVEPTEERLQRDRDDAPAQRRDTIDQNVQRVGGARRHELLQ